MIKKNKNNGEELNDGKLFYGTKKTLRDEKKKIVGNVFNENGYLKYKVKSFKLDDFTNYFGIESRVDIKVQVYNVKDLSKSHLIKIDEDYFDIIQADKDKTKRFMFLYLQKRGGLDD